MTLSALESADRPTFILLSSDDEPAPPWARFLDAPGNNSLCIELRARNAGSQNRWAARLDQTVRSATTPVLLVASGASCLAVAWWARLSPMLYVSPVAGALFLAPANPYGVEAARPNPFLGPPTLLPFPSVVVADDDAGDEAEEGQARALAQSWGSLLLDAAAPHGFEPSARPGPWQDRERLLAEALDRILRHTSDAVAPIAMLASRRPREETW